VPGGLDPGGAQRERHPRPAPALALAAAGIHVRGDLQALELHQLERRAGGRGSHPVGQDLDHRLTGAAFQLGVHVGHAALEHRLAGVLVHRRGPAAGVLVVGDRFGD
jgi:hypothetical protein